MRNGTTASSTVNAASTSLCQTHIWAFMVQVQQHPSHTKSIFDPEERGKQTGGSHPKTQLVRTHSSYKLLGTAARRHWDKGGIFRSVNTKILQKVKIWIKLAPAIKCVHKINIRSLVDFCCRCCKAISLSSPPLCTGQRNHHFQGSLWLEFTFLWNGNGWPKAAHCLYQTSARNLHDVARLLNPGLPGNVGRAGGNLKQKIYTEFGKWELFLTNLALTAGRATLQTPSKHLRTTTGSKHFRPSSCPCAKNLLYHHYNLLFILAFSQGSEAVTRDSPVLCQGALYKIKFA